MRLEVIDRSSVEKLLKVEVPFEEVNKVLEEVTGEVRKRAKLRGFREGKAPLYLVKKLFKEEIEGRSIERLIERTLPLALKEKGLEPLLHPRIESVDNLVEGEGFNYTVLVEVRPPFELKREDYIGLTVERESDEVKEEEIDRMLQEFRYSFSELQRVEEPIEERFAVVIAFEAFDGETPIPGHSAQALFLDVGTGEFNEQIEKALVGRREGDSFTIEVEYPQDALNPILAGKKVRYHIEIKEVYKRKLEELNNEFVQKLNLGVNSVEELKELVRKRLAEDKKRKNENAYRERLLDKILEKVNFEVPQRYVEIKFYQLLDELRQSFEREGLSFEKMNLSMDKLRERLMPLAIKISKQEILIDKIAELENIEIPEEEINTQIDSIVRGLRVSEEEAERIVYHNILPKMFAERVMRFLVENSKPIYKEG
ncbi:MAG: trigger factor [Caldimicrobium sp.]|nr:trigger factor [Caldimicrobium sp.]MCX7612896.1 trigger factor [Caldimicrobium sp.]MDW8094664.1 trigger factor [Caldimicrobium sp.]